MSLKQFTKQKKLKAIGERKVRQKFHRFTQGVQVQIKEVDPFEDLVDIHLVTGMLEETVLMQEDIPMEEIVSTVGPANLVRGGNGKYHPDLEKNGTSQFLHQCIPNGPQKHQKVYPSSG